MLVNLMQYLFVISGAFSALLSLLLLRKKDKKYEHLFLAAIFILITINSIFVFNFFDSQSFYYKAFFSELNYAIPLLYPPLLYLYTKSLTRDNFKFDIKESWHFLPFLFFFLILVSPILFGWVLLDSKHVGYPFIKLFITPFYLFATLQLLKKYREELLNAYSYEQKVNLLWLSWITIVAILLWILALSGFIYNEFNTTHKTWLYDYYVLSFLGVFLFILTYIAATRTDIFRVATEDNTPKKISFPKQTNEQSITTNHVDIEQLKKTMAEKKLYLDPLLSINKLSTESGIPTYRISKILNADLSQSFYDFVNNYRVEEVKRRLKNGDSKNLSILGIAQESGFNSKASFNRVFKKITNQTPSQYLKNL